MPSGNALRGSTSLGLPCYSQTSYRHLMEMAEVVAFPSRGEVFIDQRGRSRALRVAWHDEPGSVVVLSLWQGDHCTGSFRLDVADVARFVQTLVEGLAAQAGVEQTGVTRPGTLSVLGQTTCGA